MFTIYILLIIQGNLRRRFGNALLWYTSLVNYKNRYIQDLIRPHSNSLGPVSETIQVDPEAPVSEARTEKQPSEYLRRRCPLCFGGKADDHSIL